MSEIHHCDLCGTPVVIVSADDHDIHGTAVTCHYEPATEDQMAVRIAELEAELVDVVRLRAVERERNRGVTDGLRQELAALREDADAYRAIEKYVENNGEVTICSNENGIQIIAPGRVLCETMGELRDALVAAGLI